jgi:hypothetical protein
VWLGRVTLRDEAKRQFIRTAPVPPGEKVGVDHLDSRAQNHMGDQTCDRPPAREHTATARPI